MIVEPFTGATIVDSLKGLFNPSDKIGEQYKRGLMGRDSAGLYWRMDQNVVPQTFGNYAVALNTNTATFTGSSTYRLGANIYHHHQDCIFHRHIKCWRCDSDCWRVRCQPPKPSGIWRQQAA